MRAEFTRIHKAFQDNGIEDPLAETLHVIDIVSGGAVSNADVSCIAPDKIDVSQIAARRKEGIPLEYLLGYAGFAGLTLRCTADTVIPTEYTKTLVDVAADFIKERQQTGSRQVVIDIGTGCGNIPLLLAMKTTGVDILASDVSPEAVGVARQNIEKYHLEDIITLECGDLFEPFLEKGYAETVDMVLCNPPYVPTAFIDKMVPEISAHQPRIALDGGPYGVSFYQKLVNEAVKVLKPGGLLVFEIGEGQEKLVSRTLDRHDRYEDLQYHRDHENIIRVLSARKKL